MAIGWLSVAALLAACDGTEGATDAMTYPAVPVHLPQVTGSGVQAGQAFTSMTGVFTEHVRFTLYPRTAADLQ